jgi:hypothetical protein
MDLSTPQAIATATEHACLWAEACCKDGYGREALFEIDVFSYELADACYAQQQVFKESKEEAERLAKACDRLGKTYAQAFLDRCAQMNVPRVVSPLIIATLTNFMCSVQYAHPLLEEIQKYPFCIGECLPCVVRTEDFQSESALYARLRHMGIECDLTKSHGAPRTTIPLTGNDTRFSPFLRLLNRKYGAKAEEQFLGDLSFTMYTGEQRAAFLLSSAHQKRARVVLPPALFYLQDLDNLVYFLSLFNRAESIPHPLSVSWDITPSDGHPVLRKTPPNITTSFTYTEAYPHSRFRPRPELCRQEIPDSYAAPSLPMLTEQPDIALHALVTNTYDIDTALATFGAHPEYFQSENYRTLFEYILFEPEKIHKAFQSKILRSSIFNSIPFLEHQLNLAFVNQDTPTILFLLRQ